MHTDDPFSSLPVLVLTNNLLLLFCQSFCRPPPRTDHIRQLTLTTTDMTTPLRMKRMARERENLEKPNDDYFVHFENDNLLSFYAYVIGPSDTLYGHKFVKLRFDIPERYPLVRRLTIFLTLVSPSLLYWFHHQPCFNHSRRRRRTN